jgi:hypothetical protein
MGAALAAGYQTSTAMICTKDCTTFQEASNEVESGNMLLTVA